jgi:divalent metal cation (Fe/Co/Zn/Cd) transporter
LALLAVSLTFVTGNPMWDAIGTIIIGVLLLVIAIFIAVEVKQLLIGQSIDPRELAKMRSYLEAQPQVKKVFSLLTMQFGPDAMVAVKAEMHPQPSDVQLITAINAVEASFRAEFSGVRWLFFEPDLKD